MLTSTPHKRKRVLQACRPCGNRKVKCDGVTPDCSRCLADGVACFYPISKRNKWASDPAARAVPSTSSEAQSKEPQPSSEWSNRPPSILPGISSIFRSQLFQTYFRCIHPIWPVLYKPQYDTLNHEELMNVIPIPLINAMFSIAVSLVDLDDDISQSGHDQAHEFFLEALRSLRAYETPHGSQSIFAMQPTLVHCQVLTILALQQHGIAAFSQAGSLCAVAVSMAIDLRLHTESGTDTYIEAQTKSRVWWTVYVLEKMLSCEMSRPTLLRAEESDTPFPSVEESDEYELYSGSVQTGNIAPQLKLRTISAFHTAIRIAMIMEEVSREVYSIRAKKKIKEEHEYGKDTRLRIWAQLHDYEQALESSPLKLDITGQSPVTPVMVTNYIYLWLTTILLHRPFIERWQQDKGSDEFSTVHEDPYRICLVAADKICSILEKQFDLVRCLPCDLVFPIFVAGNMLLRRWRQCGRQDIGIQRSLELCVRWLNALGQSWKSAKARRQVLAESMETVTPNEQHKTVPFWQSTNLATEPLVSEDDFDLDYLQWISGVDTPGFLE